MEKLHGKTVDFYETTLLGLPADSLRHMHQIRATKRAAIAVGARHIAIGGAGYEVSAYIFPTLRREFITQVMKK